MIKNSTKRNQTKVYNKYEAGEQSLKQIQQVRKLQWSVHDYQIRAQPLKLLPK